MDIERQLNLGRTILLAACCAAGLWRLEGRAVAAPKSTTKPVPKPAVPQTRVGDALPGKALVVVNGVEITEAEVNRLMQTRRIPEAERPRLRRMFADQMIDSRLIQGFLEARDTRATKAEVDKQVEYVREFAKRQGDPDRILSGYGYTPESLREEFAVPLAWQHHVRRIYTTKKLRDYFDEHRAEFDGTQVRARQILIKVPAPQDPEKLKAATEQLRQLRAEIIAEKTTFAAAAEAHSQAPSGEKGGDVGFFPFRGKMPPDLSRQAFALKVGEISEPFTSRFGVHLCEVTDRKPGDLSLEDVREEVFNQVAQELWTKTAADLRSTARIEWKVKLESPPP